MPNIKNVKAPKSNFKNFFKNKPANSSNQAINSLSNSSTESTTESISSTVDEIQVDSELDAISSATKKSSNDYISKDKASDLLGTEIKKFRSELKDSDNLDTYNIGDLKVDSAGHYFQELEMHDANGNKHFYTFRVNEDGPTKLVVKNIENTDGTYSRTNYDKHIRQDKVSENGKAKIVNTNLTTGKVTEEALPNLNYTDKKGAESKFNAQIDSLKKTYGEGANYNVGDIKKDHTGQYLQDVTITNSNGDVINKTYRINPDNSLKEVISNERHSNGDYSNVNNDTKIKETQVTDDQNITTTRTNIATGQVLMHNVEPIKRPDSLGYADVQNSSSDYYIPNNGSNNKVPYFSQSSNYSTGGTPSWTNVAFGDGTIASSGCSITSFAMAASYIKGGTDSSKYIYPDDVVQKIINKTGSRYTFHNKGSGPDQNTFFPKLAEYYNMTASQLNSGDSVIQALQSGTPVVCHASPGKFTHKGHFIVLTGITPDGKITVNDPNGRHSSFSNETFTIDELKSDGVNSFWKFANK